MRRDHNAVSETCRQVCAVVVTHHPDLASLRTLLGCISPQVGRVLVVDNASSADAIESLQRGSWADNVTVVANAVNEGIAAAFNQAAAWANAHGLRYLLLLDQDSLPAPDMVAQLLAVLSAPSRGAPIGAVGARFVDERSDEPAPFVRIGFPFNHKIHCANDAVVECDFLISSGTLVPLPVLDAVGAMDASLFIDNIDLEWSFRARHAGYRLLGVGAAQMRHCIGDRVQALPWGLDGIVVHSPTRLYYMMRNRLLLYRLAHTPRIWVAQDVPRAVFKFLRLSLLVAPRATNARYMLAGLRDGLRRRAGPLRDS